MSLLITHKQGKLLREQLLGLCQQSSEIKVLVGFFYFSGVKALYQALTATPQAKLRVLVGAEIEMVLDRVVECILTEQDDFGNAYSYSDNEIRGRYLDSLRKVANAPEFDKESFHSRLGYFIEMLKADRLVIRKTRGENREKLFLFDVTGSDGLLKQYSWLTGSSNFTLPGLSTESDIDVRINDSGGEEVNTVFEELWRNSVTLTEDPRTKQAILDIFAYESMLAAVTPFEAYVLALQSYLDLQTQVNAPERLWSLLERAGFRRYRYQMDAVRQALTIIKEYRGVLLADVVGLGKTVIASLLVRALGKRGIIIAPPGLIGSEGKAKGGWRSYKRDFRLDGFEIFSCGKLDAALEYVNSDEDCEVVIVDEAHRFKNQDTQDYETLSNICRGRQVILLTATPFNNRPADIFSLLKLFIVPNRSMITLDNYLTSRFDNYDRIFIRLSDVQKNFRSKDPYRRSKAERAYSQLCKEFLVAEPEPGGEIDLSLVRKWSKRISQEIRHILEPIIIRRNRIDLRNDPDYKDEVTELSDMMPPVEQFYDLTSEQSEFYDQVINEIFSEDGQFKGAIYRPFAYEQMAAKELDADSNRELMLQTNLYDFMRRLLVRRFESSFGAFAQSLENFLAVQRKALTFIEKSGKFILDRKLLERIYSADEETIAEALSNYEDMLESRVMPKNNKIYLVSKFARREEFLADIRSDIALFETLIQRVAQLSLATHDPKAACLARTLLAVVNGKHRDLPPAAGEPARKVIVFSEYIDTIRHLSNYLADKLPNRYVSVQGNVSTALADTIEKNFDAAYKGQQENTCQILLSTDKMSEGHNLNRAGLVINYDIPWNPTRVIQRVGRINRIGNKVFQKLFIFNFFPTEQGADIAKSREIAATKMFMIHNTIGEDAQIFDIDETPAASSLYQKLQQNPEEAEQESFLTSVKRELDQARREHPEIFKKIHLLPPRIKTARHADKDSLLLFKRKGLGMFSLFVENEKAPKTIALPVEEALQMLKCSFDEPRLELGMDFWKAYAAAGSYQQQFLRGSGGSSLSIEVRARNNVIAGISWCERNNQFEQLAFLRTILLDLRQYGSLPDYTLRKLAAHDSAKNADKMPQFMETVATLRETLGDNYLENLKERLQYRKSEIIIAEELRQ
jgi:hypothetical protein